MPACASYVFLALLLAAPAAFADKRPEARLTELRAELEQKRSALRGLDDQERSLLLAIGELDQTLTALDEERETAEARVRALKAALSELEAEVVLDEGRLLEVEGRLKKRLRALYVLGEGAGVRALLGAQSFEDLALRRRLLAELAENDARLVKEHARVKAEVVKKRKELAATVASAEATGLALKEQAELVRATRKERAAALARIDQEKELFVRAVKEIVEQQRELSALIRRVSTPRKSRRRGRGVLREGLSWPVQGTLVRRFGTVREAGTGARLVSNGLHLRVAPGTPVQAAADGRVVFTGWMRGFGQLVILDHGAGHHTLSAHLSRALVSRGERVRRGQTIGLSGDTESLNGPKLYFELREEGLPKDPAPYLR